MKNPKSQITVDRNFNHPAGVVYFLLMTIAIVPFFGCKLKTSTEHAPADRKADLVGKWESDTESMVAKLISDAKSEAAKKGAEMAGQLGWKLHYEFKSNGNYVSTFDTKRKTTPQTGLYNVVEVHGDIVIAEIVIDGKATKTEITFIDDDTIELRAQNKDKTVYGPEKMTFKRIKDLN